MHSQARFGEVHVIQMFNYAISGIIVHAYLNKYMLDCAQRPINRINFDGSIYSPKHQSSIPSIPIHWNDTRVSVMTLQKGEQAQSYRIVFVSAYANCSRISNY